MSTIELKNVSYAYHAKSADAVSALNDVSLTLESGMITGIIGPTGSGKSTLVQLFNGILRPTSGTVLLDGEDIWAKSTDMRSVRFRVGLVMQYPEYQLFDETVAKDIAFGPGNMGCTPDEIKERVMQSARFAGLDPALLNKSPFDLSGGQKRRAALAGIIAMRPEMLVLDEPAAGLDPGGRREILDNIKEYSRRSGTGVIIVSHSMEDMAMYCDRVIVMCRGALQMSGTPAEVFSRHDELISMGLDVPQITRVAAGLRRRGLDIGDDIYTVGYAAGRLTEVLRERNMNES